MFNDLIDKFFNEAFDLNNNKSKYPLTDVFIDNGIPTIEIAIAGFSKDDIKIMLEDNTLIIKGEKTEKEEHEDRKYIRKDIAKRSFERAYDLMFDVDKINAEFDNGILRIILIPKEVKPKVKEIEIKTPNSLENKGD
jgi:HSP20 family molecular chaperone IbpA